VEWQEFFSNFCSFLWFRELKQFEKHGDRALDRNAFSPFSAVFIPNISPINIYREKVKTQGLHVKCMISPSDLN
jgi:hypothetical protein